VVASDTTFSAVPVIDVVVVGASGLYLFGSALYAHNSTFRTAVDDVGEAMDEVGNTIAKGKVWFVEEVMKAGETGVHAVDEVGRVFIEDAVSAGREESQVGGAGLHRLVKWVASLLSRSFWRCVDGHPRRYSGGGALGLARGLFVPLPLFTTFELAVAGARSPLKGLVATRAFLPLMRLGVRVSGSCHEFQAAVPRRAPLM